MESIAQLHGLIKRLKHLPGKHNQSDHASKRGGRGGASGGSAGESTAKPPVDLYPGTNDPIVDPAEQDKYPTPVKLAPFLPSTTRKPPRTKYGKLLENSNLDDQLQDAIRAVPPRNRDRAVDNAMEVITRANTIHRTIKRMEKTMRDNPSDKRLRSETRDGLRKERQNLLDQVNEVFAILNDYS